MKKLVRLLALTLVLAGSYSAYSSANQQLTMSGPGPAPLCDPANPNCSININ